MEDSLLTQSLEDQWEKRAIQGRNQITKNVATKRGTIQNRWNSFQTWPGHKDKGNKQNVNNHR